MNSVIYANGLGCASCGGGCSLQGLEQYINNYVRSSQAVPMYNNPGEAPFYTKPANRYIGRIVALNQKQNWARINDGAREFWILFNNPSIYTFKPSVELTAAQIEEVRVQAIRNMLDATTGGKLVKTTSDVVVGAGQAIDSTLDVLSVIGKNLKWIILAAAVGGGYVLYNKHFKPAK
jgi:hypothetical protein